ncbi:MAG: patatin family protein [Clostridiales bacterium]|nr:patatin family protein [Clostridiales bacterium]
MYRIGLVLEGGAFRGIFTAGVLDCLQEHNITFPYVIGVSAGAGNATSFVSKQQGRIKRVITHENADPYYGLGQLFRSGKLLDTDIMTYDYSYKQIPFDFETFFSSQSECEIVVTNCETGLGEYLNAEGSEDRLLALTKASCSVPILCKPVQIGSQFYLDGSLVDSVPAEYALTNKCDKVVAVLTRRWEDDPPTDYSKYKKFIEINYRS